MLILSPSNFEPGKTKVILFPKNQEPKKIDFYMNYNKILISNIIKKII